MEFRDLPQGCTVRIYTVRGELVQTLPGRLDRRLRRLGPAHQGQPRRGARAVHLPRRSPGGGDATSANSPSSSEREGGHENPRALAPGRWSLALGGRLAPAQSKTGTTIGQFLLIEPSARIAGMGNAGVDDRRGAPCGLLQPGGHRAFERMRRAVHAQPLAGGYHL